MIAIMFLPFLASLVLTGIHAYLGVHVIERRVIFVDLALAQVASLGALVSMLFGFELHTIGSYLFSLGFALLGATIFSLSRLKEKLISQEVIIGIVYAVASALAVIVLNNVPSEAEQIKQMLVGNILFVTWPAILKMAVLYFAVGLFHFIFRKKFLAISVNAEKAKEQGVHVRFWDFLFYATFGIVVTSSVEIAGVLLVFCYLIVPAVCAIILTKGRKKRLVIGWTIGVIGSLAGLFTSAKLDYPTGAAIVCVFGLIVVIIAVAKNLVSRKTV